MARGNSIPGIPPIYLSGQDSKKVGPRTLGIRDKQILHERAKKRCECCEKEIDFAEMQSGHKLAASRGGDATLENSVCLCYKCNKLQGTDDWKTFMNKMGKTTMTTATSKPKPTSKKASSTPKKKSAPVKKNDEYWFNPLTGKKEKIKSPF